MYQMPSLNEYQTKAVAKQCLIGDGESVILILL